jgi:5'(3')-deoxyribonucleotidase
MNIYLDMDDVVADWLTSAQDFLKMRWNAAAERIPQKDWDRLKNESRFYRNLPVKPGAHELVAWCQEYIERNSTPENPIGLYFLSAIPHDYSMPYATSDKVNWAAEHFPEVPVFIGPFSFDKYRHCQSPNDVLIDDRHSNCHEWIAAGGKAHIYTSWENCHTWLEATLGTL